MSGIDGSGADQQLACLSPTFFLQEQDRLFAQISDVRGRFAYIHERTHDRLKAKTTRDASLFYRAGVLIGRNSDGARGLVRLINRKGVDGAYAFYQDFGAIPDFEDARPSVSQIGFVYTARFVRYPHVIKVGYSASPVRRMKELQGTFGEVLELVSAYVGTMLDEARDHVAAKHRYIGRECMFAPDFDDVRPGRIPPFLLGPLRHIAED
ncbi:GIY-YIG nuclease family protein [Methylobacterium sp. WL7]|uniref:GIY-YIG nuclease family protein n=1 Tax=Methylobacterium sp. WL7 TaxID=2603900 RepID=UPI0011CA97A4|nr:GIY-YIG nuclease family protein [Methylobacterium sp. WL7]TXN40519.1 GIY-YIG nuclease family protein [Methylobacterium sp. WL7]